MFKKFHSIKLPEKRQGLIYYTCVNYHHLPEEKQQLLDKVCRAVVEEHPFAAHDAYYKALREYLISGRTMQDVAASFFVREGTLRTMQREFYRVFSDKVIAGF